MDRPAVRDTVSRQLPGTSERVAAVRDDTNTTQLAKVLDLERELQTTACRKNRERLLELLAPDFVEVGASGRVWDLTSTLKLLAEQAQDDDSDEIEVIDLTGRLVGDGFALLRWDSTHQGRRARRTSLWRHDAVGWRQVHHQGTLLHN